MLAIAARVSIPCHCLIAHLLEEVKGRMVEAMQRDWIMSFRLARKTGIEVFMTRIMGMMS